MVHGIDTWVAYLVVGVGQGPMVEGVQVQRGLVGVGRNPHSPWGVAGVVQPPQQGVVGEQRPLLQTQKGHVWPGAGLVAPSCPALSVALEQWQIGCGVCFVMTAWLSCALPAVALLACHVARLCCLSCMHTRL